MMVTQAIYVANDKATSDTYLAQNMPISGIQVPS